MLANERLASRAQVEVLSVLTRHGRHPVAGSAELRGAGSLDEHLREARALALGAA